MTTLPTALKDRFWEDGFVVVPDLLTDDELDSWAGAVDAGVALRSRLAPLTATEDKTALRRELTVFVNLWEDVPEVRPWTFHQGVASAAAQLLGASRVRLFIDQALYKESGAPGTSKHQDITRMPLEATHTLTAWIPFEGSDRHSGTLGYIPGTHRLGRSSFFDMLLDEKWGPEASREIQREPVYVTVPRGGVAFHHVCTFHLSTPNQTERQRRAFGIVYFRDGSTRESSYPHPTLDRDGVEVGEVIQTDATPIAYPRAGDKLPPPPEPLQDPPEGWPSAITAHQTRDGAVPAGGCS